MKTWINTISSKNTNAYFILEHIFQNKISTRTSLATYLGLSKPTISEKVDSFLELGIINEIGDEHSASKRGRKSKLLEFNDNYKYIISINLNYSQPYFALSNLRGKIIKLIDFKVSKQNSLDDYLSILFDGIDLLVKTSTVEFEDICCFAVAAPGLYDTYGNLVSYNPKRHGIPWWNINIKEELSKHFGLDVYIKNDVHSAALGEVISSPTINENNSTFFLSCGQGLGAAIIINGKLLSSSGSISGDVYDYLVNDDDDELVAIEDITCIPFLLSEYKKIKAVADDVDICFEDIVNAYKEQDKDTIQLLKLINRRLALMSYNSLNLLGINQIILGGEYSVFFDSFQTELDKFISTRSNKSVDIRKATLGVEGGLIGMSTLASGAILKKICNIE